METGEACCGASNPELAWLSCEKLRGHVKRGDEWCAASGMTWPAPKTKTDFDSRDDVTGRSER